MSTPAPTFDAAAAGRALYAARRDGILLDALPDGIRPRTLAEGYDAQDAGFAAAGACRAGWKLGVASPAQMRAAGLAQPLVGQLDGARCHPCGAALQLPTGAPLTVECEIAFVLDRDLPPQPGRQVAAQDIRHACVSFELVRSRFVDRRSVGWPSFCADNVAFEALALSEPFCAGLDLAALRRVNETVQIRLDGQARGTALSGDAATDPLASLAALYAHAAERGITLRAGEIVSTGAMCRPFDIGGAGHVLSASYAGGELTLRL